MFPGIPSAVPVFPRLSVVKNVGSSGVVGGDPPSPNFRLLFPALRIHINYHRFNGVLCF